MAITKIRRVNLANLSSSLRTFDGRPSAKPALPRSSCEPREHRFSTTVSNLVVRYPTWLLDTGIIRSLVLRHVLKAIRPSFRAFHPGCRSVSSPCPRWLRIIQDSLKDLSFRAWCVPLTSSEILHSTNSGFQRDWSSPFRFQPIRELPKRWFTREGEEEK